MIYWNRFISYIYRYHRNEKCENAGFIKFQKTGNKARLNIGLKDMIFKGEITYDVYLYLETLESGSENEIARPEKKQVTIPAMIQIGRLRMKNGRSEGVFEIDWNNVEKTGKPVTAWNGVIITGWRQEDIFCSSWTDNIVNYEKAYMWTGMSDIKSSDIKMTDIKLSEPNSLEKILSDSRQPENPEAGLWAQQNEAASAGGRQPESREAAVSDGGQPKNPESELRAQQNEAVSSDDGQPKNPELELRAKQNEAASAGGRQPESREAAVSDDGQQETEAATVTDILSHIMNTHEKLPALSSGTDDEAMIECVKITPNDIGLTDMANWHLGANSFLTHGFYNYKYLLFGRIKITEAGEHPVYLIGIPGIYTSKEKYLANMFGFDRFCPVENDNRYRTGRFGYWITGLK